MILTTKQLIDKIMEQDPEGNRVVRIKITDVFSSTVAESDIDGKVQLFQKNKRATEDGDKDVLVIMLHGEIFDE